MLWKLLDEAASDAATNPTSQPYVLYLFVIIIFMVIVVWLFSGRKGKQRQKEYLEQLAAIQPGNKVKTAGGICGIVVEVCEDNTVIIETGSEQSGKSYIKMDKELIAQTDAKGPTQLAREAAEAEKKAQKAAKDPKSKPELPAHEEPKPVEQKAEEPKAEEEKAE